MRQDPIIAELRRVREMHAEQFNFDLHAIYLDLKAQEEQNQFKKVFFAPKRVPPITTDKKPVLAG